MSLQLQPSSNNSFQTNSEMNLAKLKGLQYTAPRLNQTLAKRFLSKTTNNYQNDQTPAAAMKIPDYPVPKLTGTIDRFLNTCKPLLNEEQMKCTKNLAKDFLNAKEGKYLQCLLEEKAKGTNNWLADWWIHTAYLSYRNPVVCWSSPGLVYPMARFETASDKIKFTSSLIAGAVQYKLKIDKGEIKQEMLGKQPMDMQQYHKVFGTCRIPGKHVDNMQYNVDSRHFVVICNNRFFEVQCFDNSGCPMSPRQIQNQLECILKMSSIQGPAVGLLSAQNRDKWYQDYEYLKKHNAESIKTIQSSLFVVSLDKCLDYNNDKCEQTRGSHQTIFGGGSKYNAGNRWFDKTIQFIVSDDGINGLTYEHSPAEGGPVASMSDFIVNFIAEKQAVQDASAVESKKPEELKFNADSTIEKAIKEAACEVDELTGDLDMNCFTFSGYGKEFIKSQKFGPDSFVQTAMQYAYFKTHNEPTATYESCAMRHFIAGRTETIRSCTLESLEFSKSMMDDKVKGSEKLSLMRKAVAAHKEYITACLKGQGVDRHFLALKLLAKEKNLQLHPLFTDEGFLKSSYYKLATSQVPLKAYGFMCYGPVVKDGYGCCYNPRADDIIFAVSSFKSSTDTDSALFAENLTKALQQMSDIICKNQQSNL